MTIGEKILLIISIVIFVQLAVLVFLSLRKKSAQDNSSIINEVKKYNDDQEKRLVDDNDRIKGEISSLKIDTNKELSAFKESMNESLENRFNSINDTLNSKLLEITKAMNANVDQNFQKTNQTFLEIREKIAIIGEAQKKIENVETSINSFSAILGNARLRGNFGEMQLNAILENVFGEERKVYSIQKDLSNGSTVDALLEIPEPIGKIAVDSKFPLENYNKIYDQESSKEEIEAAKKLFKTDVKKHINDIADKYIIKGETAEQAIMFVPSEAIFAEINAHHPEIVAFSQQRKVWLASPTTFMAVLQTVHIVLIDYERNKNVNVMLEAVDKLSDEFDRYTERWNDFLRHFNKTYSDAQNIKITSDKITKKFSSINKGSTDFEDDKIEKKEEENKEE